MIRDFDAQLEVVLTALQDIVAPALSGADNHVIEQLMLSIATIGFVKARLPEARRFYRMDLRSWIDLSKDAAQIVSVPDDMAKAIAAGVGVLTDPEADNADIKAISRQLRDHVTALSAAAVGQPYQADLEAVILEKLGVLIAQNRQWTASFGFELQPENLPLAAW
jgi:hypothetical protein